MSLAIICPGKNPKSWIQVISELDPDLKIQVYPDINAPDEVEFALVWQHPPGILSEYPNLKFVSSMGAGVDHILTDKSIPKDLPIVRIVDEKLTLSMTNYVIMGVLNFSVYSQMISVPTSTPIVALINITPVSATLNAEITSPTKSV